MADCFYPSGGTAVSPECSKDIMARIMRLLEPSLSHAWLARFPQDRIETLTEGSRVLPSGLKCFLYVSEERGEDGSHAECNYLITRNRRVTRLQNLHVPAEKDFKKAYQAETIIDGELVLTTDDKMRFLMCDLLVHQGRQLADRKLEERLLILEKAIASPFSQYIAQDREAAAALNFYLVMKTKSHRVDWIPRRQQRHNKSKASAPSTPARYMSDGVEHELKWKPADFAVRLDFGDYDDETKEPDYFAKPTVTLLVWTGKLECDYGELYLTDAEWEEWKAEDAGLNYRIAEVTKDASGRWRFLRFRDDREHGNRIDAIYRIVEDIEDSLSLSTDPSASYKI